MHDRNIHGIMIRKEPHTPRHKCEICDAPFVDDLTLLYHHKSVHETKEDCTYECRLCSETKPRSGFEETSHLSVS